MKPSMVRHHGWGSSLRSGGSHIAHWGHDRSHSGDNTGGAKYAPAASSFRQVAPENHALCDDLFGTTPVAEGAFIGAVFRPA